MLEDWTIYSWYCPNCKTQVVGLKIKKIKVVFWASVYKAICSIKDAPEAISKAKAWLHEHGMSPYLAG